MRLISVILGISRIYCRGFDARGGCGCPLRLRLRAEDVREQRLQSIQAAPNDRKLRVWKRQRLRRRQLAARA